MKYVLKMFSIVLYIFIASILFVNNTEAKQINEIIDIGTDIYVQHNSDNKDTYILKSEGEQTTVYKIINVTYTASKQWTRDGLYIDDSSGKIGATAPEDYISVKEDEIYFVRLYGIGEVYKGENGDEWHITTPIVYFDEEGNCIGHALSSTVSASKKGVEIKVPKGATRMYVSNYNNQSISIQKKIILNESEFKKIKNQQDLILNYIDTNYKNIESDPIIYKELDKGYITFVNDDTKPNVDKFANLFISKNIPLCFAAVADNLLNNASNLKETRLEVALKIQEAGGEILAHNAPVITSETINDNDFMYNYFIIQKQLLKKMGLNVNGIILAGGTGQITGSQITAKWASATYKYSDLLGEKYNADLGIDSVYYHQRIGLGNYNNDIEKLKKEIDKAIENKTWIVFYFHDTNEITLETLNELLDYINSKSNEEIEVTTYSKMYDKFATKEKNIKNEKKTYYVSSNGTSKDGTDINNPINLETLNNKKIKTGDTILFKSGDTFFGTLNFKVIKVNDEYVTLSNYGDSELPTISTYKYINKNWEKYSDNIYRINIKDTNNYIGYQSTDTNSYNVGFIEDDNGNKYYNKKLSIESLSNTYDFYGDENGYLYMYIDKDPYTILGNLKVVVRSNLLTLSSNMKINNIRFSYTGGHAISGSSENLENIIIENCIIENIGGSYLYSTSLNKDTRYGNGIEFYGSNAKNITIKNNIFRNIYDVAFTIQGPSGSGTNIYVHDNVFINNTQDSEIWENDKATGVYNYQFYNNLSINQGRGWGYDARPDKYPAASILFWGYNIENTDITFKNNILYNPRQIYYLSVETDKYFLNHNTIKSDNNLYYMQEDTTIYRNNWNYNTKEEFIKKYNVDINSTYNLITPNNETTQQANILNNINKIRLLVLKNEEVVKSIELINVPETLRIKKGNSIDIKNIKLKINYKDGLNDIINLESDMISKIDNEKIGIQTVKVTYLNTTTSFDVEIIDTNQSQNTDNKIEIDKEENNNLNNEVIEEENNIPEIEKDLENSNAEIKEDKNINNIKEENIKNDISNEKKSNLKYIIGISLLISCIFIVSFIIKKIKND